MSTTPPLPPPPGLPGFATAHFDHRRDSESVATLPPYQPADEPHKGKEKKKKKEPLVASSPKADRAQERARMAEEREERKKREKEEKKREKERAREERRRETKGKRGIELGSLSGSKVLDAGIFASLCCCLICCFPCGGGLAAVLMD
ncbi:hypothetical protein MYCTH_2305443 [Thermothelomyces thermophilus ATCC 42464]|uniref:Uncharacterized protein n=1 Tax=Thermothelomyces thermophilus (strain ATCC 42464 / BCRC 31852 / DSM 1799) TaxID=573729 RepID=G2QD28_THET4|nr:uncharacterized protein MYCTH_2305443 [Thermothelomyces thermophilus ATCC 42464]AEO58246.1 hypothetical protein MYCTH_2305443 [Thermothelomyces thermophilus ATCC 42464]